VAELSGVGVSPGVGCGPVRTMAAAIPEPPRERHRGDVDVEAMVALAALDGVADELESRADKAPPGSGREITDILQAQTLMARDPSLAEGIMAKIVGGLTAARAVFEAFEVYRETLAGAGGYLAGRVADLEDVRDRTVARLRGLPVPGIPDSTEPFVLVARDLAPADTALLDPTQVIAFVTEQGGPTSHTAILAAAIGVPAVVACAGCMDVAEGTMALVDGSSGAVRLNPLDSEIARARAAATARDHVVRVTSGPGATRDGHPVPLLANIGGPRDVTAAVANGAEGIGLFRTEFLFFGRSTPPPAEEQMVAYRSVLEAFPRGPVVVRVLDAGAEKELRFLRQTGVEPNPALGERGLRMLRRHPLVLADQLRALVWAAAELPALPMVMAPMVTDVDDARFFAESCRTAGIERPGVMIEVPAAALRVADLAAEAEFFSIGTNDLAQYTYAADRLLGGLARLQDPWQPALLDLVALAATAAAEAGRECGVCGEAAGDPLLACILVGLGVSSLSMSAPSLPLVRTTLAQHTLDECRAAALAARSAISPTAARAVARETLPAH
jgi:phosphoenolpyruvate-protein phosphotransferase (PTS system enzyme I)